MAVTMETIPHPLLSTERPLSVRRRIILPDNRTHVAEWRYYGRSDTKMLRKAEADRGVRASSKQGMPSVFSAAGSTGPKLQIAGDSENAAEDSTSRWGYKGKELMVICLSVWCNPRVAS